MLLETSSIYIPVTYNISELDNDEEIEGILYLDELVRTLDSGNYGITGLKKR